MTTAQQTAVGVLDVLYPIRPGETNQELRYSLRSLEANLPHGAVFTVGHAPAWLTGTRHIAGNNAVHKRGNLWHNLLTACNHPSVPDRFVVMNDDFFITAPVDEVPVLFRSSLKAHIANPRVQKGTSWWRDSLNVTLICLQALGFGDPVSYELHKPFVVEKAKMRELLSRFAVVTPENPPQWRTLYGNIYQIGGLSSTDCKAYRDGDIHTPFHSTDDRSWQAFRHRFEAMFPNQCGYERYGTCVPT